MRKEYTHLLWKTQQTAKMAMMITAPAQYCDGLIDGEDGMKRKCTHLL